MQEREVIAIYDERARAGRIDHAPVWVDSFSSVIFLDLPGQGEVVDVGCGTGRFISVLPDLGISKYFGIDPSQGNIDYCRQEYPEHEFATDCVQTLGANYRGRFSGFIMTAVLMHLPRQSLRKALCSLRLSLMPGAQGMISLPVGGPLTWKHTEGATLTLFTEAEMERQLSLHGFCIRQIICPNGQMLLIHVEAI